MLHKPVSIAASSALGVMCVWMIALAFWMGVISYARTPTWDQWGWLFPDELIAQLFTPHNEHRIVLARLIFLLDGVFARGTGIFSLATVYLFQIAHAALLVWLIDRAFGFKDRASRLFLAAVATGFFASAFQFENFTSGFQCQFTGVFLFGSAAFASLSESAGKKTMAPLLAAAAAVLLAVGSMANGLIVAALAPLMALALRSRTRVVLGFAALAIACWTLYLWDYKAGGEHSFHPITTVTYVLGYIGGALPASLVEAFHAPRPLTAQLWGAVGLCGALAMFIDAARTRDPAKIALSFILLFALGSAAVTALGRVGLFEFSMLSNRYGTATAGFWTVLGGALIAWGLKRGRLARYATLALCAIVLLLLCLGQKYFAAGAYNIGVNKREAGTALVSDARVDSVLALAHPDPGYVWARGQMLRAAGYGPFAAPWAALMGTNIADQTRALATCGGVVRVMATLGADKGVVWRVAAEGKRVARAAAVVFVAPDGVVRGFGVRHMADDGARPFPLPPTGPPRYVGFATGAPTTALAAVAIDGRGAPLCRFGSTAALEEPTPIEIVPLARMGAALPMQVTHADSNWTQNGFNPAEALAPGGRTPWASWSGSDEFRGRLIFQVDVGDAEAIVAPLLTGPSAIGMSITIRQGDEIVGFWRGGQPTRSWTGWLVRLPPKTRGGLLTLEAQDSGSEWGQWFEILPPSRYCATDFGPRC